jgi:opacity protein-like surface antigen
MKKPFVVCLFCIAASAAPVSMAGWYGGVSIGESRTGRELVSNRESTIVFSLERSSQFDNRDLAWKGLVGYQVFPWLAIEADYLDLGSHELLTDSLGGDPPAPAQILLEREVRGYGADAVFFARVAPRWKAFGRVGAMRTKLEASQSLAGNIVFTNGDPSERRRSVTREETVLRYGLGVQWEYDTCHLLRLEWQRQEKIGKPFAIGGSGTTGEADTDAVMLGYVYRFGF